MNAASQSRLSPHVRSSTDADVELIHAWLQDQDRAGVHGTFLCNWSLTLSCHEEGRLQVYVDPETQVPVAYQWGGLVTPGILEVRNNMRGRGIGKEFVAHCLAQAESAGEHILRIQCKPSTSVPFWQSMGFELEQTTDRREAYATRVTRALLELPEEGDPVEVAVAWYPERRKWDAGTMPLSTFKINGRRLGTEVWLGIRAASPSRIGSGDVVLRVEVEGREWYCDKAKYERAEDLGVEECTNGFYLEILNVPEGLI